MKIAYRLTFSDNNLPEGITDDNFEQTKTGVFQYLPHGRNIGDEATDGLDLAERFKYELNSYITFYVNKHLSSINNIVLKDNSNNVKFKAVQNRDNYTIENYSYSRNPNTLSCTILIPLEELILWGDLNPNTLLVSKADGSSKIIKIPFDDNICITEISEINGN